MFILASASPRRRELLQQIGAVFTIEVSDAEECMDDKLDPVQLVEQNAVLKAMAVAENHGDEWVLGADTVVALDNHIYGKPRDEEDAKRMLRLLAGRTHIVATGIAFARSGKVFREAVVTQVRFAEMSEEEIIRYVDTGEPMGKAGAYAIQGMAAAYIEGINGSYSNVVGLPLNAVCRLAGRAGVDLYGNYGKGSSNTGASQGKTD